ncbi:MULTISPECIES: hypothetical protein [Nostocales]|uniref:Uncharacterized protein n=1 Tax=Dolichospermum flos-aquae UHCC 0037 TaxID=2590026 RepID=A0ACC7S8R6_DOLFA|nr:MULTISPECIES: hypothetical protein [Nostocales]MBO1065234.1 hypothetical protein [Anabaena sp. 54]MTJ44406.1 hypothetical protein [Dolichospermum flos-aquae UHCC 0037]
MKRISLISALVLLGGSFLLAPVAKADQELNLDFTGVAQANCLFTNIQSGTIIARGRDLGTIGAVSNAALDPVSGVSPVAAKFTSTCNSGTVFFVDTPVADAANNGGNALTLISTKSVLTTATTAVAGNVVAYTASPGTGLAGTSVRSDGFILGTDLTAVTDPIEWTVDMNAQVKSTIPVGVYKYTVLVTAVPL